MEYPLIKGTLRGSFGFLSPRTAGHLVVSQLNEFALQAPMHLCGMASATRDTP